MVHKMLHFCKILKPNENGSGCRFMKRSLFYIPLFSLFVATAVRLFAICYRLADLNRCVLEINDVMYDSRNHDVLLLDFEVKNYSLPANCEFINTIINIKKNDVLLVKVEMNTFEIEKNMPIRIKCPLKVSNINLFEFINFTDSSNLTLDFELKMKVRFLWVIIPLGFNYSLKIVNPSTYKQKGVSYDIKDTIVIGDLDKFKVVTYLYIYDIPRYINLSHRSISLGSNIFNIHVSPILVEDGLLKENVQVEIQIFLDNEEGAKDFIDILLRRNNIKIELESHNASMIESLFSDYILILEMSKIGKYQILIYDKKTNSIMLLYEQKENMIMAHQFETITEMRWFDFDDSNIDLNNCSRILDFTRHNEKNSFKLVYELEQTEDSSKNQKDDMLIEIINIHVKNGWLMVTAKILLEGLRSLPLINISPSKLNIDILVNGLIINLSVIVSINSPNIYMTFLFKEGQLELILKSIYQDSSTIVINTTKPLNLLTVEFAQNTLIVYFMNEEIYRKSFKGSESKFKDLNIVHKLTKDTDQYIEFFSQSNGSMCNPQDILVILSKKVFKIEVESNCLLSLIDLNLGNFILTRKGEIIIQFEAVSKIGLKENPPIQLDDIIGGILGGELLTIRLDFNFHFNLNLNDFKSEVNSNNWIYDNVKMSIYEQESSESNIFRLLLLKQTFDLENYQGSKVVNRFIVEEYYINIFDKNGKVVSVHFYPLELNFVLSYGRIGWFIEKDLIIDIIIELERIKVNEVYLDYNNSTLLKLTRYFMNQKKYRSAKHGISYLNNKHPVRFLCSFECNSIDEPLISVKMLLHKSVYNLLANDITLFQRNLGIYKNSTYLNIKIKKDKFESDSEWINFIELEISASRKFILKKSMRFEISGLKNNNMVNLIFESTCFGKESHVNRDDYGNLFFTEIDYTCGNSYTEIFFSGMLLNSFILKDISRWLAKFYSFFFDNSIPEYSTIDIEILKLDIFKTWFECRPLNLVYLKNSQILFNINLSDFITEKSDTQSGSISSTECHKKKPKDLKSVNSSFTENRNHFLNIHGSAILFDINLRVLTNDLMCHIDFDLLHYNLFYDFFSSNSDSNCFLSFFKIFFIKDNMFLIVLNRDLFVYLPRNDCLFLQVREDKRVILQFLINPSFFSDTIEEFHILGFASLSFLNKNLGYLFRRFFGYELYLDLQVKDDIILVGRLTHSVSFTQHFTIESFGFINYCVSTTSVYNLYTFFSKCFTGFFDLYDDNHVLNKLDSKAVDEAIDFFKNRISNYKAHNGL